MSLLNGRYFFENRQACVCNECGRFADIPSTIVHAPKCSEAVLGAHLTPRAADLGLAVCPNCKNILNWDNCSNCGELLVRPNR